jgi:hypothetical protein
MVAAWIKRNREVNVAFESGLPSRAIDYASALQRNDLLAFEAVVHARVQSPPPLVIPSLRAQAVNDVVVAMRVRPNSQRDGLIAVQEQSGGKPAEQEN